MTLFGNSGPLDLSDQNLLARLEEQESAGQQRESLPAGGLHSGLPAAAEEKDGLSPVGPKKSGPEEEEQEKRWGMAQQEVLQRWPQARGNLRELVLKMAEISGRYGDGCLWQRDPENMLRLAAMELYGFPEQDLQQVMEAALLAGQQEEARLEKERQRRLHLDTSSLHRGSPAPLSPEQEIIRAMAQARKKSIF
ncbi:MAG: hypothetical protein Q4B50_02970 [Bacillota bacterium]|nr:hypothetical protein [Bacillota bacterium]